MLLVPWLRLGSVYTFGRPLLAIHGTAALVHPWTAQKKPAQDYIVKDGFEKTNTRGATLLCGKTARLSEYYHIPGN